MRLGSCAGAATRAEGAREGGGCIPDPAIAVEKEAEVAGDAVVIARRARLVRGKLPREIRPR